MKLIKFDILLLIIYFIVISFIGKTNALMSSQTEYHSTKQKRTIEPDEYEPDDHLLSSHMLDSVQIHNFHQKADQDWGMFYCNDNLVYTIKVVNSGKNCNAVIDLFTISSQQDSLISIDNTASSENEFLTFTCPKKDIYYIKVSNSDPDIYGIDTAYTLYIENSENTDAYEEDDNIQHARIINISNFESQYHNIHDMGDQDCVKFYGVENKRYTIKAIDAGARLNAILDLLDNAGNLIITRNRNFEGEEERIFFTCEKNGVYFIRVRNADTTIFGDNTNYSLIIFYPEGLTSGHLAGSIQDASTGQYLSNVQLTLNDDVILYEENGFYSKECPPDTYLLSIKDCNYVNYSSQFKLQSLELKYLTIYLEPAPYYQCFKLTDAIIALQILADFKNQVHMDYFMNDPVNLSDAILILSNISDEENQE